LAYKKKLQQQARQRKALGQSLSKLLKKYPLLNDHEWRTTRAVELEEQYDNAFQSFNATQNLLIKNLVGEKLLRINDELAAIWGTEEEMKLWGSNPSQKELKPIQDQEVCSLMGSSLAIQTSLMQKLLDSNKIGLLAK
jgi:hypothetical protein